MMMKTGSSRRQRGADRGGLAAALLLSLCGTAHSQSASAPGLPLMVAIKDSTQPLHQLASNLRGDTVVLLHDQPQGSRHLAIVSLGLRQPGALLDVPRAFMQVDEVLVDCAAQTRSVWRSDVYSVGDAVEAPSFRRLIPIEQRRSQMLADLALSDGLMASALRTLCSTGGTPLRESTVAAASPGTAKPAVADVPGGAASPSGNAAPPRDSAPFGSGEPPATVDRMGRDPQSQPPTWPKQAHGKDRTPEEQREEQPTDQSPSDLADSKPFADTAFSLKVMGLLAEYVYYDEDRLNLLEATRAKLERIRNALDSYHDGPLPLSRQGLLIRSLRASYEKIDKEWLDYRTKLYEKQHFLSAKANLTPLSLPRLPGPLFSSFRSELYKHRPSGETVMVFRGSHSALDWLTNLWLGVDLAQSEAPSYTAARQVTAEVIKSGHKPIVVGHSLGAGMAQYVGALNGLKVVGFNSSPLPERYLATRSSDLRHVRLFSAVEAADEGDAADGSVQRKMRRDKVSLGIPNFAEDAIKDARPLTFLKAHHHLVKPLCVVSRPYPFTTPREDEQLAAIVGSFVAKGMFTGVLMPGISNLHKAGPSEQAMKSAIKALMTSEMKQPIFAPDSASAFDTAVADEVAERVKVAAIISYKKHFTVAAAGRTAAEYVWGAKWKVLLDLGVTAAKASAGHYLVTDVLRPHSMNRFNRGLQGARSGDVFDSEIVEGRCAS